jgi:hypothetical protein
MPHVQFPHGVNTFLCCDSPHLCYSFALLGCAQIACAPKRISVPFSPYGQIYRLTDAEAVTLLRDEKAPAFRESWLHTLVDTFQGAEPRRPLPPGHYLLAEAVEEQIELEVRTVQTIQVWLLPNSRDFTLTVHDSTGMPIRDARVLLRGKQAPFDTALQCYRLPRRSRNGFVEVYAAGESLVRASGQSVFKTALAATAELLGQFRRRKNSSRAGAMGQGDGL